MLIDVQRGFVEGGSAVPDATGLVARLTILLHCARRAGALVVHLQNNGSAGQPDEPGTDTWQLALGVMEDDQEVVVSKQEDDGFAGTPLGDLLAAWGVTRLVVAGLTSEMCVSATARSALARGLEVVLPRDAHGTYDLDDIPAQVVARVAEHALGDQVELPSAADQVGFVGSSRQPVQPSFTSPEPPRTLA